jgi:hypothetical protein
MAPHMHRLTAWHASHRGKETFESHAIDTLHQSAGVLAKRPAPFAVMKEDSEQLLKLCWGPWQSRGEINLMLYKPCCTWRRPRQGYSGIP